MPRVRKSATSIKTIFVPTDFSPHSERAQDYAVMLARKFNARVILFHAIEPYPYSTNDAFMIIDNSEALKKIAQSLLLNAKALLRKKGLKVKSSLTIGNPAREIAERAGKEKADLIVMGTQGKRGVEHVLLGSVAEKVVRLADCPVLTIR